MARVRVRQHVNPLSNVFQVPVLPPDWSQIYKDLSKPLHLDIGCARGRFILSMAQVEPAWNFLGLEIRQPLVEEANNIAAEKQLTNLYYFFCNANNSLKTVLQSLPPAMLQRVTIQFPDPWFKQAPKTPHGATGNGRRISTVFSSWWGSFFTIGCP